MTAATSKVFSGFPGETFGDRVHVDTMCDNDISIQYKGVKRWSLYAPTRLFAMNGETIKPLTRFDTVLHPGDALYKPPGWFHNTTILGEDEGGGDESIAMIFLFTDPPPYGDLLRRDPYAWTDHPFGFGRCAYAQAGWAKRAAIWEKLVEKHRYPSSERESQEIRMRSSKEEL